MSNTQKSNTQKSNTQKSNTQKSNTQLPAWIFKHVKLYLEDPDKAHIWDATIAGGTGTLPTLLLETVGRKSGAVRMLPLIYKMIYGNYIVVASKGGSLAHPSWFLNLQAQASCQIRVGRKIMQARARTAKRDERTDLWQQMVEIYAPYTQYQVNAGNREIPVVILALS